MINEALRKKLSKAGRKGGKNGKRRDKIRAGKAGWKAKVKKYSK